MRLSRHQQRCFLAGRATHRIHADIVGTAEQELEGVVAKRKDSRYEAGKRSGAWAKYRLNSGQELVVRGYIPGPRGVDSIIVGF